jgi:transposase
MRYIDLSPEEKSLIESLKSTSSSAPLRRRLECLLLSNGGMQVKSLSRHFGVTQKTIYEWFDLWDKGSITSMPLKGGRGAKRSFEIFPRKKFLSLLKILHENQSLYW